MKKNYAISFNVFFTICFCIFFVFFFNQKSFSQDSLILKGGIKDQKRKNLTTGKNNDGFYFRRKNIKRSSLKFQQHNNLMVISVRVNFKDSLNFVVDTGAGHILIIDSAVVQQLGLPKLQTIKIYATGIDDEIEAYVSKVKKMEFGDIFGDDMQVVFLKNNVIDISRYAGIKVHGIMGHDLFKNFLVKIRYAESRLIFLEQRSNFQFPRNAEVFPLKIEQRKPYFQTPIFIKNPKDTFQAKFLIDTGAGHLLSLETLSNPIRIQVPEKHLKSRLGTTLNGEMIGSYAFISRLNIGRWHIDNPITLFPDSLSLAKIYKKQPGRNGSVGMGFLKKFYVILDYKNKKIALKTTKNRLKKDLDFNSSGIDIVAIPPKYDHYAVGSVRKDSPADKVYVEKNDRIISVNGIVARKDTMPLIIKTLHAKVGTKIIIILEREGSIFEKEFVTEMPF